MKRQLIIVSAAFALLANVMLLSGCNIVDGIGKEVTAIGKGISKVTNDVHPYQEASQGR